MVVLGVVSDGGVSLSKMLPEARSPRTRAGCWEAGRREGFSRSASMRGFPVDFFFSHGVKRVRLVVVVERFDRTGDVVNVVSRLFCNRLELM